MKSAKWLLVLGLGATLARAASVPVVVDYKQSHIEIAVTATVDSFTGTLENYDAGLSVDSETGAISQARVVFHFNDVKTGKADRDAAMHEWQDTEKNPDGVFTLTTLTRNDSGAMTATGTLSLHGQAQEIEFPASVTHEGGLYAIDGEASLDTQNFGLPIIRKFLLLKVDPLVRVRFHLQGTVAK
jgi:polyisoprenoid-binding protein YceI